MANNVVSQKIEVIMSSWQNRVAIIVIHQIQIMLENICSKLYI